MEQVIHSVLLGVSVEFSRGQRQLKEVISSLSSVVDIQQISSVYKWKKAKTDSDLEAQLLTVIKCNVTQSAEILIGELQESSAKLANGPLRCRAAIWLLAYEGAVLMTPELTLPHPKLFTWPTLLICATEVWAGYSHPVLKKTLLELSNEIRPEGKEEFYMQGKTVLDFLS